MDEMPPAPRTPAVPAPAGTAVTTVTDATDVTDVAERQPTLPFEQTPVVALPYDDEADAPIGFALTTQARRAVAADELPDLRVVPTPTPDPAEPDDPSDTRPARARALRRAGLAPAAIAAQLGVDDLLVRAWIDDVPVAHRRRAGSTSGSTSGSRSGTTTGRRATLTPVADVDAIDQPRRHEARLAARQRLARDPGFAAEVGLLAAVGDIEPAAVTLHGSRHALLGRALAGLVTEAAVDRTRVRVVLRVGPDVAGDLARHRWAEALDVAPERIVVTRWTQAPTRDAVDALVRIPDASVAARVAGWTDALLDGPDHPLGLAF